MYPIVQGLALFPASNGNTLGYESLYTLQCSSIRRDIACQLRDRAAEHSIEYPSYSMII